VPRKADDVTTSGVLLPRAIESLRALPPDNPAKVEQIVAAALAQGRVMPDGTVPAGDDTYIDVYTMDGVSPVSRLRRGAWWRVGIGAVAAALIFGVGFVAGHAVWLEKATQQMRGVAARVTGRESWTMAAGLRKAATAGQLANVPEAAAQQPAPVATTFQIHAPKARHVAVVGDFNAWNPTATPLQRTADSTDWQGVIDLAPGRHTYTFLVDGKVVPDPKAANVRDPDYDVIVSTLVVKGGE
jgi:hypothetical protein